MKNFFIVTMVGCILLNIIAFTLNVDWLFNFDMSLAALAFAVDGIRALIDPLNLNSRIKNSIPKSPLGIKWYIASIRLLGIGCLAGSAFIIYLIISG